MSKLIGVFATEISSRVQGNFYRKLHKKAAACGYNLIFFSANPSRFDSNVTDSGAITLFKLADTIDFAAIIIHVQSIADKDMIHSLIEMARNKDVPVFLYDCEWMGYSSDDNVITINFDYKQGFAEGVRHLIEHDKCTNIYMLAGLKGNKFSDDRIDAYRQELEKHGILFDESKVIYGDFWEVPATAAVNKLLDSGVEIPDAICCANDSMAIAAAKALEQRGINVPGDILITGFDGIDDGKFNKPVISSCEPLLNDISEKIIDYIEKGKRSGELMISLRFYPKESCGCKNADDTAERQEVSVVLENMRQYSWQHSMLSNMQLELMDSSSLDELSEYINGTMGIYKGYSHLFVIRDNIECQSEFTSDFDKMRIQLNMDFLPGKEYEAFDSDEVFPEREKILNELKKDEFLVFRMLYAVSKKYGYSVIKGNRFLSNEIKIFAQFSESFSNTVESLLRNLRLEQANQKLSEMYHNMSEIYIRDVMTGLYNRNGYYQKLDEYLARQDIKNGYMHLISVDMDGMKQINDNYGHQEGDNAIKAVASSIIDCFAQPCISARFGGDEFMVALFTESKDKPDTEQISFRLNNYLSSFDALLNKEYSVGVSVGHVVCKVSDIGEMKDFEKIADDSMYANKRKRKGIK